MMMDRHRILIVYFNRLAKWTTCFYFFNSPILCSAEIFFLSSVPQKIASNLLTEDTRFPRIRLHISEKIRVEKKVPLFFALYIDQKILPHIETVTRLPNVQLDDSLWTTLDIWRQCCHLSIWDTRFRITKRFWYDSVSDIVQYLT